MQYYVYLVGQITPERETYAWRERISARLSEYDNVTILNPCDCLFSKRAFKDANEKGLQIRDVAYTRNVAKAIPRRDKSFVYQSDFIVANLNVYTPEKPILGSFFELAWAFEDPNKTVIGIFDSEPMMDIHCSHPFVQEAVNVWVKNEEEAAEIIEELIV